jgi:hypothetical protein
MGFNVVYFKKKIIEKKGRVEQSRQGGIMKSSTPLDHDWSTWEFGEEQHNCLPFSVYKKEEEGRAPLCTKNRRR